MAFNLQKVLKALLFSSSQPLSVKDIQGLFARFHDQASRLPGMGDEAEIAAGGPAEASADATEAVASPEPSPAPAETEVTEAVVAVPEETDAELYQEVPALITATQIREAMHALTAEFAAASDIYFLVEGPTGYRLVTHPRFARWIRILRNEPPPVKLTQSAIETLAIIAYRQPVTRTEIETIRGVSAEAGLSKLLERELVYITGRAALPGRPLQYGTTDRFLDFVGVKSLIELPASDVLSPRQIDEWLKQAIQQKPPTDAEMGLPLEDGESEPTAVVESAGDSAQTEPANSSDSVTESVEEAPTAGAEGLREDATATDTVEAEALPESENSKPDTLL